MIDQRIILTAGPPRPTRARVRDRYRLPVVEATILTNDGAHNYDFDAAPWLKIASETAIARLAHEEWGGTATADDVAFIAANDDPMVASILGYVLASVQRGENVYFNVYVDVEAALSWLEHERPKSYALIIAQRSSADHDWDYRAPHGRLHRRCSGSWALVRGSATRYVNELSVLLSRRAVVFDPRLTRALEVLPRFVRFEGGALDVPIAFGLADDEKSAAKWLVEHGFLHRRERTPGKAYSIGRVERPQVDTSTLSPERAALRAEALRLLAEFVPTPALRLARNYIADRRAVRERERLREQRALVQLAIIDQIAGENHRGPWGATKDDVDEARRRAPLAFA